MENNILLFIMSAIYLIAGLFHYIFPAPYLKIMPKWVPYPKTANYIAGFFEILFAVGLLFPATRSLSAWGIILLLIAVFPANVEHYKKTKGTKYELFTLLRLPLQLLLLYWAYLYT